MAYVAYITKLKNVRAHPNADRLQLGDCFGNTVCVNLDYTEDMLGVYFPCDGQLSVEFAEHNNLLRKKDDAGNQIGGYMDPDKRNITAIRLRGQKSDGLFLPLTCFDYCFEDNNAVAHLKEGDQITVVNGHDICNKYIPKRNPSKSHMQNKIKKAKTPVAPLFAEHKDTEQLAYNLSAFKSGDYIEITLKMHGTSGRTAYLPVLKGYKKSLLDKIFKREGAPIYDWGYVSGTRRTVLEDYEGGYYGSNEFREEHSKVFEGKLPKGVSVYYEIVGFTTDGTPIMASASNKKLNDKEFVKKYGDTTTFSYGCTPLGIGAPQSDVYVYRMTYTNEDGDVFEIPTWEMRDMCEKMGVKCVPLLWRGFIPENEAELGYIHDHDETPIDAGEWIKNLAELYYDGTDPIGKTHIREGIVVRIINSPIFKAYKHKNFSFKVLEGICKAEAEAPDIEEAQEIIDES